MDALITGILEFSRLGKLSSPVEVVDLDRVVGLSLEELRNELISSGGRIDVRTPLPRVRGDRLLLVQSLTNVISNTLKFVAPGVVPRITICAAGEPSRVRMFVKDNGIGIDPAYYGRVFGVFERLNPAEKYPGTGIGLAIVRRAVERMGGPVGLDSAPGLGSTFWIELPAADPQPA